MKSFEKNINVTLTKTTESQNIIFENGDAIDHIRIFNQFHKIGTWEFDVVKNHVFWSPETYEIHGLEADLGHIEIARAIKYYDPEDAKKLADLLKAAIKMKSGFQCKLRIRRRDGSLRLTEAIAAPVVNGAGVVIRLVGTFRDITSLVQYENTRIAQQNIIQSMVTNLPLAAALFDKDLNYVAWSPRLLIDANLPPQTDLRGKSHYDIFPDLAEKMRHLFDLALRGSLLSQDGDRMELPSGKVLILDWRLHPWIGPAGNVTGLLMLNHVKYVGDTHHNSSSEKDLDHNPMKELSKLLGTR